jgi:hypothetical protein
MSLTTKHSHQTAHPQSPWRHSFLVRLLLPILILYFLTAFYFNNNNNDGHGRTGMDKLLNEPVMKDPIQQEQKGMAFHVPPAAKDDPSYSNTNTEAEGEVVAKAAKADGKAAKAEAAKGDGKAGKASTAKSKAGKSEDKKKSKAAKAEAAKGDGKAAKGTAKSKAAKAGAKGTEKSKAAKSGSAKSEKKKSGEKKKSAKATAETIALDIEEAMEEEDVDSSLEDSM